GAGTERVTHPSGRLPVDLQPERGRRCPNERWEIGWVLGGRRQEQLAMDGSVVHVWASADSGLLGYFTRRNMNGGRTQSSFHAPSRKFDSYGGTHSTTSVATGMARGTPISRAGALTSSSRPPSL